MNNHISIDDAKKSLAKSGNQFEVLFNHGTLSAELYKPDKVDNQLPHTRDEIYVIASGSGQFDLAGEITSVNSGDFLFVPAGTYHHFFDFTPDFSTWVFFYGPEGGE